MSEEAKNSVVDRLTNEATKPANNGLRLPVKFDKHSGVAGVVKRDGVIEVAFFGKKGDVSVGATGTIDGESFRVDKCERSSEARNGPGPEGMIRLTVTAVTQ
ncbi:MAG: hypothetical protein KDA43_15150 [Hyphomonas sp.]|nr:hypothetical protein [Hyphomonas sp.]